jgi:hypothetical protein
MKHIVFFALAMVFSSIQSLHAEGSAEVVSQNAQVVEGVIIKVKESRNEIYVRSTDGKRVEIYLSKDVKIQRSGAAVKLSELKKDTKVRVTGKSLVEIL